MKKIAAGLLLALTLSAAGASAAFAKNGADDANQGRVDCRHGDTICVTE